MRRLLDTVQRAPLETENFALPQRPTFPSPSDEDLDAIQESAKAYFKDFEEAGVKSADPITRSDGSRMYQRPGMKSERPFGGEKGALSLGNPRDFRASGAARECATSVCAGATGHHTNLV